MAKSEYRKLNPIQINFNFCFLFRINGFQPSGITTNANWHNLRKACSVKNQASLSS